MHVKLFVRLKKQLLARKHKLEKQRTTIELELSEINEALGSIDTSSPGNGIKQKRNRNKIPLRQAIKDVLKDKPLERSKIAHMLQEQGIKFKESSLYATLYNKTFFKNEDGRFAASF